MFPNKREALIQQQRLQTTMKECPNQSKWKITTVQAPHLSL